MKKLTDFIVEKKYLILVIVIILSSISLYIGNKVSINYDIAQYLPNDSETRIGMDIMEDNFPEIKDSNLNIMFENLDSIEKLSIKKELEETDNVSSVIYDDTEQYNKDNYTLFIINVDDTSDSKIAKDIYNDVNNKFKDYKFYLSGSIEDYNKPVLHIWIVVFAVCCAMIILILMCNSYIEPFLFLFVILLAVALNKGTNIIFSNVSHITNAISAILQMALSMDYSIMLMNRYTQEKENEKDKNKAMKKALYNSFKSISSSSITTIVGLMALVFMSFTIGRDLGFVLAKGVLFSLLTIFLCLPSLILLFDSLITKTKKKSLSISLEWLGKFSYKFRYLIFLLFLGLFIGSFVLKGNLKILYTNIETNEIGKHFKEQNQIAIIYNNKFENEISDYCKNIANENVSNVLCYGNTIDESIKYGDLNNKLEELGNDSNIDDYLLKLIYYNYYNEEENTMSLNEFIKFVETEVYKNEDFQDKIDNDIRINVGKLKNFSNKEEINKKRSSNEIASILGIDKNKIDSIFVLYNADIIASKLSVDEFIKFLNDYLLSNKKYSNMFTNDNKILLNQVLPFTDKDILNKKLNSKDLSLLFNMNENDVKELLLLGYIDSNIDKKLTLDEFVLKLSNIKRNTNYLNKYNLNSLLALEQIAKNNNNINSKSMNKNELKYYFGSINSTLVDAIYNGASLPDQYLMTPVEFIDFTLNLPGLNLDDDTRNNLKLIKLLITSTLDNNSKRYSSSEMATILGIDNKLINSLYALINVNDGYEITSSPIDFINTITNNITNDEVSSKISDSDYQKLELLKIITFNVNNNIKLSFNDMSKVFNISQKDTKLIYSLYEISILNKNVLISLNEFVPFLTNNVINDKNYASALNEDSINKLKYLNIIMKDSLSNKKYSAKEFYNLIRNLGKDLDQNLIDLVYIYEGSINNYNDKWEMTIENFITYIHDDILNDRRFLDFINEDMISHINNSYKDVSDAKNLLKGEKYSRMVINTTYSKESDETFDFIKSIKEDLNIDDKEIYIIGDSPMAYDMSQSFGKELTIITILTMLFIYIVVAITFKSLIIPLILVLIIQCAVYITMGSIVITSGNVYFIALLIVQSILMGATIDYAIVYTSYYKESRLKLSIKDSLINAYNKSIHTILTSASILIIVTLVVAKFASAIAAKICATLSRGTLCSVILILFILPSILVIFDKFISKNKS